MDDLFQVTPLGSATEVAGIGVDILDTARIRCLGKDLDDAFFRKTFTEREVEKARDQADPLLWLAMAFAGKEAVFKCLGMDGNRVRLNEIEIEPSCEEPASVRFLGKLDDLVVGQGIGITHLQVLRQDPFVLAFAIAERAGLPS
jgi:holo-[acyl-carrier protein] synthase